MNDKQTIKSLSVLVRFSYSRDIPALILQFYNVCLEWLSRSLGYELLPFYMESYDLCFLLS